MSTAFDYGKTHAAAFREQLFAFLRIPSISTDPAHAADVRKAAEWLAENMRTAGLKTEIITTERHPLVYGEWLGAGDTAPTVLVYGHYDVQPATKSDGWDTEPFDPVEKEGVVYARGATDDKGQMFIHVKAVESLLKAEGSLPVNVKFLIEGEEEAGSGQVMKYVQANPHKLKADVCVISDTSMETIDKPMIISGLRGMLAFELTVTGPKNDLHSGMYGGAVHNPAQALAEIITRLHKADGSIAVPGFYDDVPALTPAEREVMAQVPFEESRWRKETGAPAPWGEENYTLRERVGARPTLEVNGMAGGYYEAGHKSIIPEKAWAKMSCRLVPHQDPQRIAAAIEAYIKEIAPNTVQMELTFRGGAPAAIVDVHAPAMQAAIAAYEKGWGAAPAFVREGGSIPIVSIFQAVLGLPVIMMGFGLNSDNLHAPNEHFSLAMFYKGIDTMIHFYSDGALLKS